MSLLGHGPLAVWLRQIAVMVQKELRQLYKDRVLFLFIAYIFTFDLVIAAGGASLELKHAPLAVRDEDHSGASRALADGFRHPHFAVRGAPANPQAALRLLDTGGTRAVLTVPRGFADDLEESRQARLQLLVDASHANNGYLVSNYAERIVAAYAIPWAQHGLVRAGADPRQLPRIEAEVRTWYNPELQESWFNILSELLTMMTVAAILLPAAALVREKERGTIEQLLVSPLSPLQVVLSKLIAMILVTLVGTGIAIYGIMQPFYAVPFRGDPLLFLGLTALFAAACAGLGLATATFARNSAQVSLLVLLIVMPIVMLSGTWAPLESMPPWLRGLMNLSPLRHYVDIAYGIVLRGAGIDLLWQETAKLAALALVLGAVGVARFRRQFH